MAKKAATNAAAGPKTAPTDQIIDETRDEGRSLHQTGVEDRSFRKAGFDRV